MIMNENTIPLHAQSMFIEIPKLLNQNDYGASHVFIHHIIYNQPPP